MHFSQLHDPFFLCKGSCSGLNDMSLQHFNFIQSLLIDLPNPLQLVHELLVARIVAAAGLDQARAQVLADHLVSVQVAEDAGEQVRDVLAAQRGGAQTQQLRLGERLEREGPHAAGPAPEAVVKGLGVG